MLKYGFHTFQTFIFLLAGRWKSFKMQTVGGLDLSGTSANVTACCSAGMWHYLNSFPCWWHFDKHMAEILTYKLWAESHHLPYFSFIYLQKLIGRLNLVNGVKWMTEGSKYFFISKKQSVLLKANFCKRCMFKKEKFVSRPLCPFSKSTHCDL